MSYLASGPIAYSWGGGDYSQVLYTNTHRENFGVETEEQMTITDDAILDLAIYEMINVTG